MSVHIEILVDGHISTRESSIHIRIPTHQYGMMSQMMHVDIQHCVHILTHMEPNQPQVSLVQLTTTWHAY